ncbi:MAG: acyltransferase [Alphaproteobacteria bacterium]|nr:acyltransferase [Alphaproteobacteria bacterium]
MRRRAELDGLRAVAILLVIAFHSWFFLQFAMPDKVTFLAFSNSLPWIAGFIRRGDIGVDIFFVLSGYLLCWQMFAERRRTGMLDFRKFYLRRLFRIYPLYLLTLALVAIGRGPSWDYLGNILAYNIWLNPFDIIIPWTWSLSIEIEFYAIAPLLILLARSGRAALLMVLAFAVLSVLWALGTLNANPQLLENSIIDLEIAERREDLVLYYQQLYSSMPIRLTQFLFGLGAAWVICHRAALVSRFRIALVAGVVLGLILPLFYNPHGGMTEARQSMAFIVLLFGRVGFAFAIAALIALMQVGLLTQVKAALSWRWLEPIARFSFAMYLYHPVFVYLGIVTFIGTTPVETVSFARYLGVFAVAVAGSTALGFVSWHAVEHPAIRFGQRLIGKRNATLKPS